MNYLMKYLKFREELVELILKGEKTTTWRINDEKNIVAGDELSLQRINGEEFARARVLNVKETTFGKLKEIHKEGHEKYKTEEEIYRQFSKDYKMDVTPETPVKVIKFKLL